MARFLKSKSASLGKSPGSLIFIGDHKMDRSIIRLMAYSPDHLEDRELDSVAGAMQDRGRDRVSWINIYGLEDTALMGQVGECFGIHPLLMEDILNTDQRPTFADQGEHLFAVLKMLRFGGDETTIISEQLSLVLGTDFVLTFQERRGDVFEPVRERIRKAQGRIRMSGPDYLAYALLDTVVDNYIHIIERLGERVEDVEEEILEGEDDEVLGRINTFKLEMNYLRKAIRPSREALLLFSKVDSDLVQDQTYPFLRDLQELATQASEAIDTYREMLTDQLNTYRTAVGTKLNEIMKVLTIFAAIFIPLTFMVGVYGTNFEYLPELHLRYGYFILWGMMILVAGLMLRFFRKKGWL